jgi:hypothetical protein
MYYERIVDKIIEEKLKYTGAVYIRGPKWCGKSTSAKRVCNSFAELGDIQGDFDYVQLADLSPALVLSGDTPRLIDEWQLAPQLWNAVKSEVDRRNLPGQFVLTGSSTPITDDKRHPGTGRIAQIVMYPMSLYESKNSTGTISLMSLLTNQNININGFSSNLSLEDYAYLICRGGWPTTINLDKELSIKVAKDYVSSLLEDDISRTAKLPKNTRLTKVLLRSYARNVSTIDSYATIFHDVQSQFSDISDSSLRNYLNALENLYIIDEIEAWNPNLRSKTVIRTSKKKSFIDPSIAAASLGISPNMLLHDLKTFGVLFENLVTRDLKVYANLYGGSLNHYRDKYGLECDAVIHFDNGHYMLVEVKLGSKQIDEAAKNLLKLKVLATEKGITPPSSLVVITAGSIAYLRADGIFVVPLGCLKP